MPSAFGSDRGLYQVATEGSATRLVSAGPALHARRLDAENVIVLNVAANSSVDRGARVERVSLQDGARGVLAALPPFACAGRADDDALSLIVWPDSPSFKVEGEILP